MSKPSLNPDEPVSAWPRALPWLTVAALADWLITRTLTRAGIFMPKAPAISTAFQWLGTLGQLALTTSAILATALIGWYAWQELSRGKKLLPAAIVALIGLIVIFLVVPPSGWAAVLYHVIAITALLAIAFKAWKSDRRGLPWSIPAAALLAGELYITASVLEVALRDAGIGINGALFFNVGELLFVASGFVLWWFYGRESLPLGARILPLLVALTFSFLYVAQPAMAGIISIWSTGLTLYLPWPLYAISLYAAVSAAIVQLRRRRAEGLGILLLLAAGFAPQLSHQFLMGLIGLLVICHLQGVTAQYGGDGQLKQARGPKRWLPYPHAPS